MTKSASIEKKEMAACLPTDPHPFVGDKKHACQRCGGSFYGSIGHWRKG